MVKLQYNGSAATGLVTYTGGSISVVRGHVYDISKENVKHLLANGEWKLIKEEKVIKEKVKEDIKVGLDGEDKNGRISNIKD